jgi:hypothetical protein
LSYPPIPSFFRALTMKDVDFFKGFVCWDDDVIFSTLFICCIMFIDLTCVSSMRLSWS